MKCFFGFRVSFIFLCAMTLSLFGGDIIQTAFASCDFNNDGFADIAVGIQYEDVNLHNFAGAVQVIYGSAGGLSAAYNQFWNLDSPNILGDTQNEGFFGAAVACGDFNGDGRDDLAVGSPLATVDGVEEAGTVSVLYSSDVTGRLSGKGNQLWSQNSPGIFGSAAPVEFGSAVAAGDFNGDGFDDLAIGVPKENPVFESGIVQILYGSSKGLSATGNQVFSQSNGIVGKGVENSERFGFSLVAADFGHDTSSGCYDDLAISVPGEGTVNVIYGSASGLTVSGNQLWDVGEGTSFVALSLAAGSFRQLDSVCGKKKISDLVIGVPENTINAQSIAGSVTVIYGTNSGLTETDRQIWTQDSPGIADKAESVDEFGYAVAAGHTTSKGEYLVIGVPTEQSLGNSVSQGGAIHILYTDPSTGLLTSTGSKFYNQDTPGIKDKLEQDDFFGLALATGDFNADGEDDLVVGVPGEDLKGVPNVGAINVLYGAGTSFTQFFHQNKEDMKDVEEADDQFGSALSP